MPRLAFHAVFLVIAGAWLGTLGACGRTMPGLEPGDFPADDDDATGVGGANGARGGTSAKGGASGTSSGGSNRGGSGATANQTGGSSNVGGTGVGGTGEGGSNRGGTAGTSEGGSVAVGGSAGDVGVGGSVGLGGGSAVGGASAVGGSVGVGGAGGSVTVGGAGGSVSGAGGSGATGGTSTMPPGGIRCGDEICDPAQAVCCARRGNPSYCAPPSEGCPGTTLACSGPSTCAAGEVCCFHFLTSSCSTTCDVTVGSPGNPPTIILCDSSDDCDPDQICAVSPRGLAYCGDTL